VSYLILEQQKIPFTKIIDFSRKQELNPYSNSILKFCATWLRGETNFEISSSGSTGEPKIILWSREMMRWSIRNTAGKFGLKKDMHCLHCIDAEKAGGKMMLARALELQMSIEIITPSSKPMETIVSSHFDFAAMVPLQVHELIKNGKLEELNKIDCLIIGGATMNTSDIQALQNSRTKIYTTYGMTETASHIALQRINGNNKDECFIPFADVNITINEKGCAVVTSPFHQELVTHDLIEFCDARSFKFIGRIDNIINSGGYKIPIEKIEAATDQVLTAMKINFFNYCAAKRADEKLGEALILIMETQALPGDTMDEFKKELSEQIEKYEMPKKIYFTDKLIYTSSGKIDRRRSTELVIRN
jgi:O-succinylbenzoic acid--CoA ligase